MIKIEIIITDGEKTARTGIDLAQYRMMKDLHGVSTLDLQVDALLEQIEKTNNA
jgi:hypothetical protein